MLHQHAGKKGDRRGHSVSERQHRAQKKGVWIRDSLLHIAHARPATLSDLPHTLGESDRSTRLIAPDLKQNRSHASDTSKRAVSASGFQRQTLRATLTKQLPSPSSSLAVMASVT